MLKAVVLINKSAYSFNHPMLKQVETVALKHVSSPLRDVPLQIAAILMNAILGAKRTKKEQKIILRMMPRQH